MSLYSDEARAFYKVLFDRAKEITIVYRKDECGEGGCEYRLALKGLPQKHTQLPLWVVQKYEKGDWQYVSGGHTISTALAHYMEETAPDARTDWGMEYTAMQWAYDQTIVLVSDEAYTVRLTFNHLPASNLQPGVWLVETRDTADEKWDTQAWHADLGRAAIEFLSQHTKRQAQGFAIHKDEA